MAYSYPFFHVTLVSETHLAEVQLTRPEAVNAMDHRFWEDFPKLIAELEADPAVRFVSFHGAGAHFTAGLDVKDFYMRQREKVHGETADTRMQLQALVQHMQSGFNALARGHKIYIAALHGYCIGAGLDLAAACDLRLASADARISLREARVGIVADLGSLQRLPAIIGLGNTKLLAYTARDIDAETALRMGLVQEIAPDKDQLLQAVRSLVAEMAGNPFLAVSGSKQALSAVQKLGPEAALDHIALYNAAYLDSNDFREVIQATLESRKPNFQ